MKTAAASVISASASAPPMWNSRRKTSEVLRKLSLNAAKNWVQNRGAKRRVISRDEDMAFPLAPSGAARARLSPSRPHGNTIVPSPRKGHPATAQARLRASVTRYASRGPRRGARARAAPTGAGGLRDDNLGKTTIAPPCGVGATHWRRAMLTVCKKQRRAARGRPPLRCCHVRFRYRRRGCPPRSIRMAATLRQTAAPHASVKSEIHMASLVLLSTSPRSSLERAVNAEAGHPFPELCFLISVK